MKAESIPYPGLLQPLTVPSQVWTSVSMDFIEGLPKSNGKTVILLVVDRLSKYAHFMALSHPFTARIVAKCYFDSVIKLHRIPTDIVCDRDKIFTSQFCKELFQLLSTRLPIFSSYHLQSDDQTNFRCDVTERPTSWSKWLSLVEWWYNNTKHIANKMTPFKALYGYSPIFLPMPRFQDSKVVTTFDNNKAPCKS